MTEQQQKQTPEEPRLPSMYSVMARDHWKRWLPKMYSELQAKGTLDQEIMKAQIAAEDAIYDLLMTGVYQNEAEEIVLPQYILLPPEKDLAAQEDLAGATPF